MKKTVTILITIFIGLNSLAQNGVNYKAIIKDGSGNVLVSSAVSIQFTIYEGAALNNNVYLETHTVNTDANGLIFVNIGEGTTSNVFQDINWGEEEHFLNVNIDTGSGFVDMGTTPFSKVPYAFYAEEAANVSGLEAIDEGNGIGWRLKDRNQNFYGDIGENAVDFSYSNSGLLLKGALGLNSFATGFFTEATGNSATSMGYNTEAAGDYSTSLGFNTESLGDYSFASGRNASALGNNASALGYAVSASGESAVALGQNTDANSILVTAIGRYNIGGGNATAWYNNDPLFEIGNGSSQANRSNALTVYKNGFHNINSSSTGLNINADSYGLFVSNSGNDAVYIVNPGDDGVFISSPANDGVRISEPENNGLSITNAGNHGADIEGDTSGLYVRSSVNSNADIILRGNGSGNDFDDGIITSDPSYSSSDIYLRSNDAVVIELDTDDNEPGSLIVRNGEGDNVFTVNEYGNMDMGSQLNMTFSTIQDYFGEFIFDGGLYPDIDDQYRLGASTFRWHSVYSTNGIISTSDRRSKTNITSLNYGLKDILKLEPISFNWKKSPNEDTKLGLIAQDLLKVIPEVVKTHDYEFGTDENGNKVKKELDRLGVYYSDLVPVLIKAIQEQQIMIEKRDDTILNLVERVERLESGHN